MQTFKQYITEVFDKSISWNWKQQDKDFYMAEFVFRDEADDNKTIGMLVRITNQFDLSSPQEIASGNGNPIWELVFSTKNTSDKNTEIQNFKDPKLKFAIFATVIEVARAFAKKAKPNMLYLSAKEPSRKKLYTLMTKRLAKDAGYNLDIFTLGKLEFYFLYNDKKYYNDNKDDIKDEIE